MNKDLVLQKNDKVTYVNSVNGECTLPINTHAGKSIKQFEEHGCKVLKVERPVKYETIYEIKEILDEKEKEYLGSVIKPFRDRIKSIRKCSYYDRKKCWIDINLINNESIPFPFFNKNAMYKGMELDKEYTLEELGL